MTQINDLRALAPASPPSPNGHVSNGHRELAPAFAGEELPEPSALLELLPAIYSMPENEFAGRFLRIFEHVLDPVSLMVDNQPYYFDPLMAPREVLDYMAMWVGLEEGADWPLARRRALVAAAATLYRKRGTREGIKQHVGIYSGGLPLIGERTSGFRLDPDARLGLNTVIGEDRPRNFVVTIAIERPDELDVDALRAIIESDKPVDTSYDLHVVPLNSAAAEAMRRMRS